MHYYIDGYNCLFRAQGIHPNLQLQRRKFLEYLSRCVGALKLSVTIVFDSAIQEESTRGHLDPLEYIYTNQYETADACLVRIVEESPHPTKLTIVTSDEQLARVIRLHGAYTLAVTLFLLIDFYLLLVLLVQEDHLS